MNTQNIPQADFAIIGGSGTLSSNFPLGAKCDDVKIIQDRMVFDTPYGKTTELRLFEVAGTRVLTCKMHGWRSGVNRADASRQLFWTFREAGVKRIFSEGGVG